MHVQHLRRKAEQFDNTSAGEIWKCIVLSQLEPFAGQNWPNESQSIGSTLRESQTASPLKPVRDVCCFLSGLLLWWQLCLLQGFGIAYC